MMPICGSTSVLRLRTARSRQIPEWVLAVWRLNAASRPALAISGLQPVERFLLSPLLVAPDQIADVFADVLIGTILADGGQRYQSKLFNPEFLRGKGLPVPAWMDQKSAIEVPFEEV